MIREFLTLSLLAALGIGCATVSPSAPTADDPASPQARVTEEAPHGSLLVGSEPLAQWLATNRVDAAQSEHRHDHGQHGQTPASKTQGQEHQHE